MQKKENMDTSFIKALLSQSDASGSRSTILKPLIWLIGVLLGVFLTLIFAEADLWLHIIIILLIVAAIGLYFYVYYYCLRHNPDALRSESFTIQKLQIEKGIFGDSNTGYLPYEQNQTSLPYSNDEEDSL